MKVGLFVTVGVFVTINVEGAIVSVIEVGTVTL